MLRFLYLNFISSLPCQSRQGHEVWSGQEFGQRKTVQNSSVVPYLNPPFSYSFLNASYRTGAVNS